MAVLIRLKDGLVGGSVAAIFSGAPSTLHALATGRDPLEATKAAGTILPGSDESDRHLILAAVPVHVALSLGWGVVLSFVLPRRCTIVWGLGAGAGIAWLDLGLARRWWPRVAALPQAPQVADHLAFGALAAAVIGRRRSSRG